MRELPIKAGQIWTPTTGKRAKPRRVIRVGTDRCYGHDAVTWTSDYDAHASTMQGKAFLWWIRKHSAVLFGGTP